MRDLEQAANLLRMAEKDCRALRGMEDAQVFAAEVFGFHVQQAVEKALKAWLCCLGATFPKIHDLDELGTLLEDAGQHIPASITGLLDVTDFAWRFATMPFPISNAIWIGARPSSRSAAC